MQGKTPPPPFFDEPGHITEGPSKPLPVARIACTVQHVRRTNGGYEPAPCPLAAAPHPLVVNAHPAPSAAAQAIHDGLSRAQVIGVSLMAAGATGVVLILNGFFG